MRRTLLVLAFAAALLGCGDPDEGPDPGPNPAGEPGPAAQTELLDATKGFSRDARFETEESLQEDLALERHPGDGGGSARLLELFELGPAGFGTPVDSVRAGSRARVRIRYEAGPEGIAEGGILFLQTSPFWEWQPAQTRGREYDGYSTAKSLADGVELEAETYGQGLVGFTIRGRPLAEGERVEIVYGAGPTGARVDRYAERESPIWLHVDADGDGVRSVVAESPSIHTRARLPSMLVLRVPTTAEPGDEIELRASLLDALGNAGYPAEGELVLSASPGLELPTRVAFEPDAGGTIAVRGRVLSVGVHQVTATIDIVDPEAPDGFRQLVTVSNPLVARAGIPSILWADLHGHSNLTDGTGTPEDFYRYARDVAGLDVAALTDHDHWGMRFLDANPELWKRIGHAVADAHEPGRFVALLGYEWTSWLHGHRHVLYFEDEGPIFSSIEAQRRFETPSQLWDALRGRRVLTFAHHSAGGAISTNWDYAPDPELEPVTEIVSVHGSSEAPDSPRPIYSPVAGNYVRDALGRGYVLGLIGSGDSHDGHPGLTQLSHPSRNGGLAAIVGAERTRESVLAALRERRVYATNGARIFLRTTLDGEYEMGSLLPPHGREAADSHTLDVRVASLAPIDRVDVVRSGKVALSLGGEGRTEWSTRLELSALEPGETLYVRVVLSNDDAAWSSPFFAAR